MKKLTLVLGVMFLMLGLSAMPVAAAEKSVAKADGKKTTQKKAAKPTKCWQRLVQYAEAEGGESTRIHIDQWRLPDEVVSNEVEVFDEAPVCVVFEEVLNTTCELPEKLQCKWTLPEGEKRFKKLEWKPLDPKEYRGLTEDYIFGEADSKNPDPEYRKMRWNSINPDFKKAFDEDTLNIKAAIVDINQNEQDGEEQVVRYSLPSKCAGTFSIMNPETKRVDWKRNEIFFHVNALSYYGSEILLYNGKAFMFKIMDIFYEPNSEPSKEVILYEGYSYGSGNVCRFKYLKGGTKP